MNTRRAPIEVDDTGRRVYRTRRLRHDEDRAGARARVAYQEALIALRDRHHQEFRELFYAQLHQHEGTTP